MQLMIQLLLVFSVFICQADRMELETYRDRTLQVSINAGALWWPDSRCPITMWSPRIPVPLDRCSFTYYLFTCSKDDIVVPHERRYCLFSVWLTLASLYMHSMSGSRLSRCDYLRFCFSISFWSFFSISTLL